DVGEGEVADGAGEAADEPELRGGRAGAVGDAGDRVAAAVEDTVEGVDALERATTGEVEVSEKDDVLAPEVRPVPGVRAGGEELQVRRCADLERSGLGALSEEEAAVRDGVAQRLVPDPLLGEVPAERLVRGLLR